MSYLERTKFYTRGTIKKQEFLQLIEDVPEISKAVINQLLGYLQKGSKV